MEKIFVTVVDDEPDVRLAIKLLLESVGHNVQTFESAQEFWNQYDPEQQGCLILDVRMPGMNGLELQEQLKLLDYHPPIIMISGHGEIPMAVKAIQSGAIDFLQKPFSDQVLLDHVSKAIEQDKNDRSSMVIVHDIKSRHSTLTPRELEVLDGVVNGKLNKTIASELNVSTRTIEIHRANMMEKMEVKNLSALMRCISNLEEKSI